jgi:DNA-binding GntR family transcriptional regulator
LAPAQLEQEKQEIYLNFTKAIHEVHQKSSFKNQLLEKKLRASSDVLEMREAQMNELAAAANVDPSSAATRARRLEVKCL